MTDRERACIDQAYRFLSLREHNKKELILKLKEKGYSQEEIKVATDYLSENGSLSEERYVESFIRSNNRKHPEGKGIVMQRLLAKGADKEISQRIISEIYDMEYVIVIINYAIERLKKKGKSEKIRQELQKAGFTSFEISEALNQ